jgi:hypothetical protein
MKANEGIKDKSRIESERRDDESDITILSLSLSLSLFLVSQM